MLSAPAGPSFEPIGHTSSAAPIITGTDHIPTDGANSPWQDPAFLGPKPLDSSFGCIRGRQTIPCTDFRSLRGYIAWDKAHEVRQVWTPDSPWIVTPEEVPSLFHEVHHREQIHRKHALKSAIGTDLIWALLGVTYILRNAVVGIFFLLAFIALPMLQRVWAVRRAPAYSPQDAMEDAEGTRFGIWVRKRRTVLTWCLVAAIILVWPAQLISAISHIFVSVSDDWTPVEAVGLVKNAVWEQGQWWRLFTATVMHQAIWHAMFNVTALFVLGMVVEAVAGWQRMAVVFLLSALAGSLFSLFLVPATSIGSSGGVLGLLGFLLALAYFRRGALPRSLQKAMISSLRLVLVVGLVGFTLIDNAAHVGGLLCGALLGVAASRLKRDETGAVVPLRREWPAHISGSLAVATLMLTLAITLMQLFPSAAR